MSTRKLVAEELKKIIKMETCPKCGGDMVTRNFRLDVDTLIKIRQCRVCQFYVELGPA